MAGTFVAASSNSAAAATVTVSLPTGWAAGDLFYLTTNVAGSASAPAAPTPTGYTSIRTTTYGTTRRLTTFAKVAASGDSLVIVAASGATSCSGIIEAFRGVGAAVDGENGQTNAASTSATITGGISPTSTGDVLGFSVGINSTATLTTAPSGFTIPTNGSPQAGGAAYETNAVSGSTGTLTGTIGASQINAAHAAGFAPSSTSIYPLPFDQVLHQGQNSVYRM